MKKKHLKKLVVMFLAVLMLSTSYKTTTNAETKYVLNDEQLENAEMIAEICTENWQEYGCLPSVCIGQAYMESHLGKRCYENNLWGLYGGRTSFDSLEEGIYEYLEIINNGRYDDALYHIDPEYQINAIYDGGYCTSTREHYVGGVTWIIDAFDLTKYDQEILEKCTKKTYKNEETWKCIK